MVSGRALVRLKPIIMNQNFTRRISFDKLSNKKITRIESDIELNDCEFKGRLINRNPRNMEQMSYEIKPSGFWLEKSAPSHWNRLILEQSNDHLDAYLRHWSGKIILKASTSECQLSRYFKSPDSIQAATILGAVLARRCLQSGYLYAGVDQMEIESGAPKLKAFLQAVVDNGFCLEEPPQIEPRSVTDL